MTKILLAVEDKKFGESQVDFLRKHQFPADMQITLLAVIKPLVVQDYGFALPYTYLDTISKEEEKYSKNLLADIETRLLSLFPEAKVNSLTVMGGPAEEIIKMAKEGHYDWIVMGSHGRSGLDRFLLGSVSQKVVNNAHCSVTIVRLPQEQQAEHEHKKETASSVKN